jgi:hypothetical protein
MKWILSFLFFLALSFQIYAQAEKEWSFNQNLFTSSFATGTISLWPLKSTSSSSYFLDKNHYYISSTDKDNVAFIFPRIEPQQASIKAEMKLTLQKGSDKDATAGIVFQLQNGKAGGYIAEINGRQQCRVSSVEGPGNFKYLTSGKDGWVSASGIHAPGQQNVLSFSSSNGYLVLRINGGSVWAWQSPTLFTGQNGIFISGRVNMIVTYFNLYGPDSTITNQIQDTQNQPVSTVDPQCAEDLKKIKKQFDDQEIELALDRQKVDELQTFIQKNLDVRLQKRMADMEKENEKLRTKIQADSVTYSAILHNQTADNSDSGALIRDLSLQIQQLTEENKKLKDQNRKLQSQIKNRK